MRHRYLALLLLTGSLLLLLGSLPLMPRLMTRFKMGSGVEYTELWIVPKRTEDVRSAEWIEYDLKKLKAAEALATRPESGPVRCTIKACDKPSSPVGKPNREIEVEVVNTSDRPAIMRIQQSPIDVVTFIMRNADGKIVNSFCSADLHSDFSSLPPIYLQPRATFRFTAYIWSITQEYQGRYEPGFYTLEAVFHEHRFGAPPGATSSLLSRSKRLLVHVR
jgi:hypothetical protein